LCWREKYDRLVSRHRERRESAVEYEIRVIVEKVAVGSQEVIKRDTLKVYELKKPNQS
jgi:hypothetical protein